MKNILKTSAIAAAIVTFSTNAMAAGEGTATAKIILPLSVTQGTQLDFSEVIQPSGSSATVIIDSATSAVTGTASTTGTASRGVMDIAGEASKSYTITAIPDTTLTGPGTAMNVTGFTVDGGLTQTLDGSGNDSFGVGATLTVGDAQTTGTYTGSYDVTVNY